MRTMFSTPRSARWPIALAVVTLGACSKPAAPDAYGNIEADEVIVSAQTSGQLERFDAQEGASIAVGDTVALVDTIQISLERRQLEAQRRALGLQRDELARQQASVHVQREIAQRGLDRTMRLLQGGAATAAQRDQQERDTRVLTEQERAAAISLQRVSAEADAIEARLAALTDRQQRARVRNPTAGTVLVTYVHAGEIIQPGQPLYRVADLDTLTLRAYVTGGQLAAFRLGETVQVHTDAPDGGLTTHEGRITWVSSRAEFTPTPVQTREDRTDLVYAVKIRVPNPKGLLKIGMPADVTLPSAAAK
ncbi:MAG: efflux RND transporter periplasmic adaptor subunit [Gemmatimonadaceae bacterium]|jgi:HlyD family secretion protein|nr:efflux RND transporter periplasmic adaptor subunit [Gemmatimonadaceae bacterium]